MVGGLGEPRVELELQVPVQAADVAVRPVQAVFDAGRRVVALFQVALGLVPRVVALIGHGMMVTGTVSARNKSPFLARKRPIKCRVKNMPRAAISSVSEKLRSVRASRRLHGHRAPPRADAAWKVTVAYSRCAPTSRRAAMPDSRRTLVVPYRICGTPRVVSAHTIARRVSSSSSPGWWSMRCMSCLQAPSRGPVYSRCAARNWASSP